MAALLYFPAETLGGTWTSDLELRPRFEGKAGAGFGSPHQDFLPGLASNSNSYFWLRTTVGVNFEQEDAWRARLSLRDMRQEGDRRTSSPLRDDLDIYELWLTWPKFIYPDAILRTGRQQFVVASQRLLSHPNNGNGLSFDGFHFEGGKGEDSWQLMAGSVVSRRATRMNLSSSAEWVSAATWKWNSFHPIWEPEFYAISRHRSHRAGSMPRDIYNLGFFVKNKPGSLDNWEHSLEFVLQRGSVNSGDAGAGRLDHRAWALAASSHYTFADKVGRPRTGFEYTLSPGDKNPDDMRSNTLDMMFGSNHTRYGRTDLFGWRNLHILSWQNRISPWKGVTLHGELLGFWMARTTDFLYSLSGPGRSGNGYGRNPGLNRFVGWEMDLAAQWKMHEFATLQAEYAFFRPGDYIRQSIGSIGKPEPAHFYQLTLTLRF